MNECLDLLWQFACRSWQLWGALAFVLAPAGLLVVAAWDFADWLKFERRRNSKVQTHRKVD